MSQEKTSVPGMENSYYANKKNNMYSRTTTPDMGSRGTMVPGMEYTRQSKQQRTGID